MSSSPIPVPVPTLIATGRFANTNENDHSGVIWISALLCLIYSTLVLVIRAHLRWAVRSLDDYFLLAATLLQTCEVVAVTISLKHGLGQSHLLLTADQIQHSNVAASVSVILFIASTTTAKLSIIALMMRLFNLKGPRALRGPKSRRIWSICLGVAFVIILWGVGSIIGLSVKCNFSDLTTAEGTSTCPQQALRWDFITAFDISTEFLLVFLSILIVWPVQLKVHVKVPVVFAFSFRLGCALISLLHLYYINLFTTSLSHGVTTSNPGLTIVPVVTLIQMQLCWSMISATIPNLKPFLSSFNSGCGLGLDADFLDHHGNSDRTRSRDTGMPRRNTDTGTIYELSAIKTPTKNTGFNIKTTTQTTILPHIHRAYSKLRPTSVPPRPSLNNVDVEGISLHPGIAAIPGFGAGFYSHHVSHAAMTPTPSMSNYTPMSSPDMASSVGGRTTPLYEMDGSGVPIGRAIRSSSSRERIIRKEMQYEVRYEMA